MNVLHEWFKYLTYSNTCVKQQLSKRPKIGFQDQLSLNAGQKYCRMLQGLPFVIKIFVLLFLSGRFTPVLLYLAKKMKEKKSILHMKEISTEDENNLFCFSYDYAYGRCSKILNTFLNPFSIKCWLSGLEFTKCLSV